MGIKNEDYNLFHLCNILLYRATVSKFDRNSFPAVGLPYFGTSVRQKVDGDGGLRSRKHSSNNRITSLIFSVLK